MIREIVQINEELCDGCGQCIPGCHEGALQLIDGKARLVSEIMCDGLGACIGHCPQGAITIEKRESAQYNEIAVMQQMVSKGKNTVFAHLKHLQEHGENGYLQQALEYLRKNRESLPFNLSEVHELLHGQQKNQAPVRPASPQCPGTAPRSFDAAGFSLVQGQQEMPSALTHWPVQLHLINPAASVFRDADLLIAADCTAFAYGDFHRKFIAGKKTVIACPKLDQGKEIYLQKFIRLIDEAEINTINLVIMEVPCCGGLISLVQTALSYAKRHVPVKVTVISTRGEVISEKWIPVVQNK